jgi:hypothetical protein
LAVYGTSHALYKVAFAANCRATPYSSLLPFSITTFNILLVNMDHFDDDIAAMALGSTTDVSLEEAAEAYEKEGVRRMIKLWKRSVSCRSIH